MIPKRSIQKGATHVPAVIKETGFNPTHGYIQSAINDFLSQGNQIKLQVMEISPDCFNKMNNQTPIFATLNKPWFE